MLTIAPVCAAELGELAGLYEQLTGRKSNLAVMANIFGKIINNQDYLLLGAKDQAQRLVGSLLGILCMDMVGECRPFMVLENVIVSKRCRRQGIGREMIQYIENYARERNCYYVMMISLLKRTEAHAFYEQAGYKPGVVQGYKKYL
ncbi:GNAT family N-acetyltransferase [Sporomusa aerivorans]|uniref:GNAT family N-acetyltransferase n=1 Tax=Sporomusa aerivorans TaxID=204936 RepID=UPI00352A8A30